MNRSFMALHFFSLVILGCNESKPQLDSRPSLAPAPISFQIENESAGSPGDIQKARKFFADLPHPACSSTSASVMSEGTVRIRLVCEGNGKSMDGIVTIKNGIVTNIQ